MRHIQIPALFAFDFTILFLVNPSIQKKSLLSIINVLTNLQFLKLTEENHFIKTEKQLDYIPTSLDKITKLRTWKVQK